ncbi:hypothetical protein EYF80_006113 [Liparis tanakae]|uniref:Uncharacterized protein n=1 Tax=Liparis tanakae TaxID=230148 RepID=A0A4Z2IZU6_9TELE|nr:hypothetical protein EYF80_006113 [Liparis tanakae]
MLTVKRLSPLEAVAAMTGGITDSINDMTLESALTYKRSTTQEWELAARHCLRQVRPNRTPGDRVCEKMHPSTLAWLSARVCLQVKRNGRRSVGKCSLLPNITINEKKVQFLLDPDPPALIPCCQRLCGGNLLNKHGGVRVHRVK